MNELISFNFENRHVRALTQNGEPWFIARDVGDVLGIGNIREIVRHFPQNEKGVITTDTLGGKQQTLIINEPGLYRMVFQSRKPEAERFKTWVFSKVLPEIRKTGGYGKSEVHLLRESLMSAQLERETYKQLWEKDRKTLRRYENKNFLTWADKYEILNLAINKFPVSRIKEITKKGRKRIKDFLDSLPDMNDAEFDDFYENLMIHGKEGGAA